MDRVPRVVVMQVLVVNAEDAANIGVRPATFVGVTADCPCAFCTLVQGEAKREDEQRAALAGQTEETRAG